MEVSQEGVNVRDLSAETLVDRPCDGALTPS
jgi:hypothetical protein